MRPVRSHPPTAKSKFRIWLALPAFMAIIETMKSTACLLALVFSAGHTSTALAAEQGPSVRGAQELLPQSAGRGLEGFYSYHTRLQSGEPFERYARVGDAADIIVKMGAPEDV